MTAFQKKVGQLYRDNSAAIWLFLIVLLAAALRLNGLTFQSYWYDELFSAHISNPGNSIFELVELTLADVHPPFFQLSMWGSYKFLGYTEWAGRLPSMLAGILAIPATYLLGRELFNKRTGIYAAALATPNYYLVAFSQEARSYMFLYLFCCMSFYYFMRALRRESWVDVALYIFFTVLLLYTHYFGFVLLAIQGSVFALYVVLGHASDRKLHLRAAVAVVFTVAAVVPLVPAVVSHAGIKSFWITQPQLIVAINYFVGYFQSGMLAILIIALILIGMTYGLIKASKEDNASWLKFSVWTCLLWIAIGFMLPWLRGLVGQPVITDRNTIMLIPPLLLLAAFGIASFRKQFIERAIVIALLVLALAHLTIGMGYYKTVRKNQFREMAASLDAYKPTLPVYTLKFNDTKYNVYFQQMGSELSAMDAAHLEASLAEGTAEPVFWLADGHRRTLETDLEERFGLEQVAFYKHKGTAAELLVNPARAKAIPLEQSMIATAGGNWHSEGALKLSDEADQILVALNPEDRAAPLRNVQVDLLDFAGRVLESYRAQLGDMPSSMQIKPQMPAGQSMRLLIRLPEGDAKPNAWIIVGSDAPE